MRLALALLQAAAVPAVYLPSSPFIAYSTRTPLLRSPRAPRVAMLFDGIEEIEAARRAAEKELKEAQAAADLEAEKEAAAQKRAADKQAAVKVATEELAAAVEKAQAAQVAAAAEDEAAAAVAAAAKEAKKVVWDAQASMDEQRTANQRMMVAEGRAAKAELEA